MIATILRHSELFAESELITYTNEQLYRTLRSLFLTLREKTAKLNS